MEIRLSVKTPGTYLSTETLFWIMSDFVKVIYSGIYSGIIETYPAISKTKLKKQLTKKHLLYFTDIKRGSWEFAFLGALGALLLKILYDLGIDIVKNNSTYKDIKDKINGNVSDNVSKNIKKKIEKKDNYGSLIAEKKKVDIEIESNGKMVVKIETVLIRREGAVSDFSGDDNIEIDQVIEHLKILSAQSNNKNKNVGA